MNLNDLGVAIEENETVEDKSILSFSQNFKKKIKSHTSLFENSFTQKISTRSQTNFNDFLPNKYIEFELESSDFLTDLQTLTAHVQCKILEDIGDNKYKPLGSGDLIGLIPGALISNLIKNFRLFLYQSQINSERPDKYSLISYITQYFDSHITDFEDFSMDDGFFLDQSRSDYLVTTDASNCSKELYDQEAISKGFYQAGQLFAESTTHHFCQILDSPFLFSQPNLLLPTVSYFYHYRHCHCLTIVIAIVIAIADMNNRCII